MKRNILWLVASGLMVLSLMIAACGPVVVEEQPTTPASPQQPATPGAPEQPTSGGQGKETAAPETPKYGGVLTRVVTGDAVGWDDVTTSHASLWNVSGVYRPLLIADWTRGPAGTGEFDFDSADISFETKMGALIESWEFFEEGRAVYKIRKGIHFALDPNSEASRLAGGRELTANDVTFALKRAVFTPGSYIYTSSSEIVANLKINVIDKYTFEVAISPDQFFSANYFLCYFISADIAPEVIEKYGGKVTTWKNVVGTGPMMLKDYVPGSLVDYVRNPNYFEKDPVGPGKGNQLPYLDGYRILILPDASTRQAALRSGKIDYLSLLTWEDAQTMIKTSPQLAYQQSSGTSVNAVFMRTDNPDLPYKDIRVRQALMLATDYPNIIKTITSGLGRVPSWPFCYKKETADFYCPFEDLNPETRELYSYNPTKAKALLKEAGYPNGFTANVIVNSTGTGIDELSIFKAMWEKIGITLNIQPKDSGVFTRTTREASHTDMIYAGTGETSLLWLRGLGNIDERTSYNLSMINQEYIKQARRDMQIAWLRGDTTEWARISREDVLPRILWEAWAIPMPQAVTYNFWQPWLKNYYGAASPGLFIGPPVQYVWIDQDIKKSMGK